MLVEHLGATVIPHILSLPQQDVKSQDLPGMALVATADKDKVVAALSLSLAHTVSPLDASYQHLAGAAGRATGDAGTDAGTGTGFRDSLGVWRQHDADLESGTLGLVGNAEWGDVLYVGKAKNLRKRVLSYVGGGGGEKAQSARIGAMIARAQTVDYIITPDGEHDALLLEARLIKKLQVYTAFSKTLSLFTKRDVQCLWS